MAVAVFLQAFFGMTEEEHGRCQRKSKNLSSKNWLRRSSWAKCSVTHQAALLAFLFREKGHEIVLTLFEKALDADRKLLLAAPN